MDRETIRAREEQMIHTAQRFTLRQARALAGLSQKEIADRVGVRQQTYLHWEQGRTYPNVKQARLLAIELGIDLAQIIFE